MRDLWIVASYTFKDLVKRKSFIISNLIILIIMLIAFNIPNIMNAIKGEDSSFGQTKIVLIDEENLFEGSLESLKPVAKEEGYELEIADKQTTVEQIQEKIKNEELESAIVISKKEDQIHLTYLIKSMGMASSMPQDLVRLLQENYKTIQMGKLGVSQEQIAQINMPFQMQVNTLDDKEAGGNIFAMMLLSIVLFYAIYFYAYQVSTSITTEKTSKIIETLVTSTSPKTIVLGKTLGIGLAGIMQTAVLVIVAIVCANVFLTPEMVSSVLDMSHITPMLAVIMIVYYILGYALFALLYALTGSTVSKPEDIQSANTPVAIMAVIGFYFSYFTMMNPSSDLNAFAAIFPISSPFCMPFRVMMGIASTSEVFISLAVLVVTILVVAHVSIKIYSSAILNYGSKMSFKDIVTMYKNKND